ncbi:MAG: S9 family peptidase [Crocinitomicaceae bacterium]|nr:S9 family peptidase [Crocinitomicaceae bacterium]
MRKLLTIFTLLVSTISISQEKKIVDHTVYDGWKSLKGSTISNDGKYISYEVTPHKGDGYLFIYNTESKELDSIPRATGASFSGGSVYLAFKITPGYDTLRICELEKVKKAKWPKDSLGIYILENDSVIKMPKLGRFTLNDENDWAAILYQHNKVKGPKKKKCVRKKDRKKQYTSKGHVVQMYHPSLSKKIEFKDVKTFEVSEEGTLIAMTVHHKIKEDSFHLEIFNTANKSTWVSSNKYKDLQKLTFNDQETKLAYLASKDTAKVKVYSLAVMDYAAKTDLFIADTNSTFIPKLDAVSIHKSLEFTKDGKLLYFGVADIKFEEPKDTLLDSEKVKLDLWHYKDKRLQPQQLLEKKADENRTDLYVYHFANSNAIRLSDDTLEVRSRWNLKGKYLMGTSTERYAHTFNWVAHRPQDYFRIDIETGKAELLQAESKFGVELSPSGLRYTYYDGDKGAQIVVDLERSTQDCMTCDSKDITWSSDLNGMPMEAYPRGEIGWNADESLIYLQSKYDIWSYDLRNKKLISITDSAGMKNKIRLSIRYWSYDSVYIDYENVYLNGFDEKTKGIHNYKLIDHGNHTDIKELAYFDARMYGGIMRSKNKERFAMRKMTFKDYPELYTYTGEFNNLEQISNTNPQQSEYNWGTAEIIDWEAYDGTKLEGILYKPENFDATKSYPLMVYFYELYSDRLHQHYIPKPTASIIYASEYASAGYVVFMPDIRYKEGHPAQSAYDCIMSGTDRVLELLPNVDSTRMALQGQSWGGYQTAQLVTMTERYAAAMAGAPVTNMFSAYGGIRWGSGYNRQFQYERTQSRIGYTIWERPDLYVENSPQFHLPNVTTPLMIMHNDGDGAVPWYQGIELFTGLKRLDKTAWLLNYNGDGHNLMRNANRIDLSIRMRQFFDHYLLDKPAPQWLTEGIPAVKKGKELRYD